MPLPVEQLKQPFGLKESIELFEKLKSGNIQHLNGLTLLLEDSRSEDSLDDESLDDLINGDEVSNSKHNFHLEDSHQANGSEADVR